MANKPSRAARTVSDFRAAHDQSVIVPNKIRKALAAIVDEGAENWDYEADFVKRADISQSQLGQYREQFLPHIVETNVTRNSAVRRVWFGSAKVAGKVRGE